jgi:uracil-DNA glycosylase
VFLTVPTHNPHPELVAARKSCRICMARGQGGIVPGAQFDFDPNVVSYWSQWLGHPNPHILVVGQDFGDVRYFERYRGVDQAENPTNNMLYKLLRHAGLNPRYPPNADTETRVFLTNSILCLKQPPMSAPILRRWVKSCAINHLRPLVKKLSPPIVVAMGRHGWRAICDAVEITNAPQTIGEAAGGKWDIDGVEVFAVGHCGPLGLANRPEPMQFNDWARIGQALKRVIQT